jgi:hypothetical protein
MSQRRHDRRAAMCKRHADALAIAAGACNPSGIASSIIDACQEIRRQPDYKSRGTIAITSDPAVRLMVYQLAFVCGADSRMDALGVYDELLKACQRQAQHTDPCSTRAPQPSLR